MIRPLEPVHSDALGKELSMKVINNDHLLDKKKKKKAATE